MLSKIRSFVLNGLDVQEVEVETDQGGGIHSFTMVGLPDATIKESKERVFSAIRNSGLKPPYHFGRITVSLAPSNLKKTGCGLDLSIAVSILEATGQIQSLKGKTIYFGELALDGRVRKTKGVLPIVIGAKENGYKRIVLPLKNADEGALIEGIEVIAIGSVSEYISYVRGEKKIIPYKNKLVKKSFITYEPNISQIKGQEKAKRALTIIGAGGHNLLMTGPPGTGKTFIARTLPSILPDLNFNEVVEVTKIYSASGLLTEGEQLIRHRPFRSPHHTSSNVALVGGGTNIKPGEITLSHRGVLFLDEVLEYPKKTLESLRQPLEDGIISISRASGSVTFPARFILVAAMNPCPCGYLNDEHKKCTCSTNSILKYQQRLSGPIMDRIDLFLKIPRINFKKMNQKQDFSIIKDYKKLIKETRKIQKERFENSKTELNSEMNQKEIDVFCKLNQESKMFLEKATKLFNLSTRSYFRILKISRTIADIEKSRNIKKEHLAEALQFQERNF